MTAASARIDRAFGIARSLVVYYGQPWRNARRRQFYAQFVGPGDIAFDVGSHVGDRVRTWRTLGARVVAVEPQPDFARILRLLYGRDRHVTIVQCGLGATVGTASLRVSSRTPTVSSSSTAWIDDVTRDPRFARIVWDREMTIEIESLDRLIARYGVPQFVKIDVEGLELDVLRGLHAPVRALSFEYIPIVRARACACIDVVTSLGDYRFRHSVRETTRWAGAEWLRAEGMKEVLEALPDETGSGDVYACRADALP